MATANLVPSQTLNPGTGSAVFTVARPAASNGSYGWIKYTSTARGNPDTSGITYVTVDQGLGREINRYTASGGMRAGTDENEALIPAGPGPLQITVTLEQNSGASDLQVDFRWPD